MSKYEWDKQSEADSKIDDRIDKIAFAVIYTTVACIIVGMGITLYLLWEMLP